MTRIDSFEVHGLAGRSTPYGCTLSPDVNVFFGLNGSGKTSLLKILHSALRNNSGLIRRVPFESATVNFYSHDQKRQYTRTITKAPRGSDDEDFEFVELDTGETVPVRVAHTKFPDWTTKPRRPTPFRVTFLSTSRLAVSEQPRFSPDRPGVVYNEARLDELFAEQVQQLWRRYSNRALSDVRQIQEAGLAEILQSLFARENASEARALDAKTAYARANDFLARQGVHKATGTLTSHLLQEALRD